MKVGSVDTVFLFVHVHLSAHERQNLPHISVLAYPHTIATARRYLPGLPPFSNVYVHSRAVDGKGQQALGIGRQY